MFRFEDGTPEDYRNSKEGVYNYDDTTRICTNCGRDTWVCDCEYSKMHQATEARFNPSEAAAKQVGGNHYSKHKIQPWDIVDEYGLDHYRATAIKYILRDKDNSRQDIQKAIHCLEHWLEVSDV